MRVVLDTDVIVAALRSPRGASAELLRAARVRQLTLLLSVPLAVEYEALCSRAEHLMAAGLTRTDAEIFVDALIAMSEPVETHFLWRPQLRDPVDEMVLEAAVNGGASALVTFNRRDFKDVPARFGIDVLLPRSAVEEIRQ